MGQILVEVAQPAANMARAAAAVAEAASQGAQIVILPEAMDAGWTDESVRQLAEPIPGPRSQMLSDLAVQHKVFIASGISERGELDGATHFFNSALLIGPDGRVLIHHRKINELKFARSLYTTGTTLSVARTELGVIGLNICADNFSESLALARAQGWMGAQLLVSPSAWAVEPDHDNNTDPFGKLWTVPYRTVATEFEMAVVGVTYVGGPLRSGNLKGRYCIGNSIAMGKDGVVAATGRYGRDAAEVLTVELALKES